MFCPIIEGMFNFRIILSKAKAMLNFNLLSTNILESVRDLQFVSNCWQYSEEIYVIHCRLYVFLISC